MSYQRVLKLSNSTDATSEAETSGAPEFALGFM
jgi:hypothetical protein